MSSPLTLILAPEASDDFAGALQYTLETWGNAQVAVYRAILDETLLMLCQHPHLGRARPEIGKNLRSLPAGSHVILYEAGDGAVYVHRILHSRMDIAEHV